MNAASSPLRIGIAGFGAIGRAIARAADHTPKNHF